jgi:hypothetical protein
MSIPLYKRKWFERIEEPKDNHIYCKICGKSLKSLTCHISRKHNIFIEQYREMFPFSPTISIETSKKMEDNYLGNKDIQKLLIRRKFKPYSKIRMSMVRKQLFEEGKLRKLSDRNTKKWRKNLSESLKGRTFSEEHKRNLSKAMKGNQHARNVF